MIWNLLDNVKKTLAEYEPEAKPGGMFKNKWIIKITKCLEEKKDMPNQIKYHILHRLKMFLTFPVSTKTESDE